MPRHAEHSSVVRPTLLYPPYHSGYTLHLDMQAAPLWKKWTVIGVSAGASLAIVSALVLLGFTYYSSRPVPWNKGALSVMWSEAQETLQMNKKNTRLITDLVHVGVALPADGGFPVPG
jgi:hypothetical protein